MPTTPSLSVKNSSLRVNIRVNGTVGKASVPGALVRLRKTLQALVAAVAPGKESADLAAASQPPQPLNSAGKEPAEPAAASQPPPPLNRRSAIGAPLDDPSNAYVRIERCPRPGSPPKEATCVVECAELPPDWRLSMVDDETCEPSRILNCIPHGVEWATDGNGCALPGVKVEIFSPPRRGVAALSRTLFQ